MGILQSPTVFSVIDVFVLRVVLTVLQAPTFFILFIAVSVFQVAHRATALRSDKAVESLLS